MATVDFAVGIGGENGQGVASTGDILARIFARRGLHLNAYNASFIPAAHEGDVNRVLGEFHPRDSTPMSLGFFPCCCARTATNMLWNAGSVIIGTETSLVRPASLAA